MSHEAEHGGQSVDSTVKAGESGVRFSLTIPLSGVLKQPKSLAISYGADIVRCTLETEGKPGISLRIADNYVFGCLQTLEQARLGLGAHPRSHAHKVVIAVFHAISRMDLTDAVHRHGLPALLSMQEDVEKARWCPQMTLLVAQFDDVDDNQRGSLVPLEYVSEPVKDDGGCQESGESSGATWESGHRYAPTRKRTSWTKGETYIMMEFLQLYNSPDGTKLRDFEMKLIPVLPKLNTITSMVHKFQHLNVKVRKDYGCSGVQNRRHDAPPRPTDLQGWLPDGQYDHQQLVEAFDAVSTACQTLRTGGRGKTRVAQILEQARQRMGKKLGINVEAHSGLQARAGSSGKMSAGTASTSAGSSRKRMAPDSEPFDSAKLLPVDRLQAIKAAMKQHQNAKLAPRRAPVKAVKKGAADASDTIGR